MYHMFSFAFQPMKISELCISVFELWLPVGKFVYFILFKRPQFFLHIFSRNTELSTSESILTDLADIFNRSSYLRDSWYRRKWKILWTLWGVWEKRNPGNLDNMYSWNRCTKYFIFLWCVSIIIRCSCRLHDNFVYFFVLVFLLKIVDTNKMYVSLCYTDTQATTR